MGIPDGMRWIFESKKNINFPGINAPVSNKTFLILSYV